MQRSKEYSIIEYMILLLNDVNLNYNCGSANSSYKLPRAAIRDIETARKIKDFLDEIPGGFLIYKADKDEQIVFANKALIKIFNCASYDEFKELTGGSFRGIVHSDDLERVENSILEQIQHNSDDLDYVEYRIVRKDGIVRWVEDYGHFIRGKSSGDFYYVFISDATEKVTRQMAETATIINAGKQKEQQLQSRIEEYDRERKLIYQEHLQRLEVIEGLSINYDSILYADLDANKVLPYRLSMRLERQFEKKLQVRELKWFLNDYVKVWVHPDDRNRVKKHTSIEYIRDALKKENTYYINYRCLYNGEIQYIQLRIVNVGDGSDISQVVMGYRNIDEEISQEMKQEQLLKTALENAKTASIAKNAFLSNMSHDMRTPLNAIFGYIALARKNVSDAEIVKTYLDKIEFAGKQILDLVDKVLALSYTESQDFAIKEQPCDIVEILRDVYNSALPDARCKNVSMQLSAKDVRHTEAEADEAKLKQILAHIVGNAVKYSNNNGKVGITLTEHEGKSKEYSTYAFEITDTGVGISKEALPRIFEPFEREHNTTSSGVYGAGLGLTISKHLIEAMGGNITVKSELNKGTAFTITVSLKTLADVNTIDADPAKYDFTGTSILIVEDNEINLEIETEILSDLGFTIDTAKNGKIAVEKLLASPPDKYALVLMDIQMPIMDGRTATREIRKQPDPKLNSIPIIALSANAFESDKRESIEAGMDAHLSKPIDIPVLLDAVYKAINKSK